MTRLKILALTKYGRLGASSRMRSIQYESYLINAGFEVVFSALLTDEMLIERYKNGAYQKKAIFDAYIKRMRLLIKRHDFDLVWIEKEAFPWWPLAFESAFVNNIRYVLDYDDAIFHNYDLHSNSVVRMLFSSKLDRLMQKAALVVCGNRYLAQRAIDAGSQWTEILPTVIDLEHYPMMPFVNSEKIPYIVWIGSPSTAIYLQLIHEPLKKLALETPFILKVIGADPIVIPGVQVKTISWEETTEVAEIAACAVGIMPLNDSPWERGKCGYKLIQYMACGLPVVASAVGANLEIVTEGEDGFLVDSTDEWVASLYKLLKTPLLRKKMGLAGRKRVEENYCIQKAGPRLVKLLSDASKHNALSI